VANLFGSCFGLMSFGFWFVGFLLLLGVAGGVCFFFFFVGVGGGCLGVWG